MMYHDTFVFCTAIFCQKNSIFEIIFEITSLLLYKMLCFISFKNLYFIYILQSIFVFLFHFTKIITANEFIFCFHHCTKNKSVV